MFQNASEQRRSKGQFFSAKNSGVNNKLEKQDANQEKKHNTLQVNASYSSEKLLAKYIELENNLNETAEKKNVSLLKEVKSIESVSEMQKKENNLKDKEEHQRSHDDIEDFKNNDHEQYVQDGLNFRKISEEDKENKIPKKNSKEEIIRGKSQYEEEISILKKQKMILEEDMKYLKAENAKLKGDHNGNNKGDGTSEQASPNNEDIETMSEQVDAIRKEQYVIDLENKLKNLMIVKEELVQKLSEAEDDIRMKDKQIEGLKFDVNHMKDFIFQHHSESFFATTEDEDEDHQKTAETFEVKSPQKLDPSNIATSVTSFPETLDADNMSQRSLRSPINAPRPKEDLKDPVKNSLEKLKSTKLISEDIDKNEGSIGSPGKKPNPSKNEGKSKQQKESEPANKRLEKLVKELNEKLIFNEKNTKKEIEARVLEASRQFQEREQKLYVEIESLKEDKKALLKKIEDMEWEKAYEYSDRMRKEKLDKETIQQDLKKEQAVAATITEAEAKKKKKKKKKTKTNETNAKESDSD